jgi:hypothetical protein
MEQDSLTQTIHQITDALLKMYDTSTNSKTAKAQIQFLDSIAKSNQFFPIFNAIITSPDHRSNSKMLFWACKEMKYKLRLNYYQISGQQAREMFELYFEVLRTSIGQFTKHNSQQVMFEILAMLISKFYHISPETVGRAFQSLQLSNSLEFISAFPNILSDEKIVLDDEEKDAFVKFCLNNLFPEFITLFKSQNLGALASSKEYSAILQNLFSFYQELMVFILNEARHVQDCKRLFGIMNDSQILLLSFTNMFEICESDGAYEFLSQFIRNLRSFEDYWPQYIPIMDQFVDRCYQFYTDPNSNEEDVDSSLIIKLLARIFDVFGNHLMTAEKALFLLLMKLNKQTESINSLVLGINRFVKNVCRTENHTPYVPFLNLLWKKIPILLRFDKSDFEKNEVLYLNKSDAGSNRDKKDDDDFEESLFVRENIRTLCGKFAYFFRELDLLPTLRTEIMNILDPENDEAIHESFSYFLHCIFQKIYVPKDKSQETIQVKRLDKIMATSADPQVAESIFFLFKTLLEYWTHIKRAQIQYNIMLLVHDTAQYIIPITLAKDSPLFESLKQIVLSFWEARDKGSEKFNSRMTKTSIAIVSSIPKEHFAAHFGWTWTILVKSEYDKNLLKILVSMLTSFNDNQVVLSLIDSFQREIQLLLSTADGSNSKEVTKKLKFVLQKMKSVIKNSSSQFVFDFKEQLFHVGSLLVDTYPSDFDVSEKTCQLLEVVLNKSAKVGTIEGMLKMLEPFLLKINYQFSQHYLPCYLYYYEIILGLFYRKEYLEFFFGILQSVFTSFFKLVDLDRFDGETVLMPDGSRASTAKAYAFLYDQNGLQIEDILDDLFGLVNKYLVVEPALVLKGVYFIPLLRLLDKVFNSFFIYNITMMIPLMSTIIKHSSKIEEHQKSEVQVFWTGMSQRALRFIIEESLMEKTVRKLFKFIFRIARFYHPTFWPVFQNQILSISNLILTEKERTTLADILYKHLEAGDAVDVFGDIPELNNFVKKLIKRAKDYQSNAL